MVVAWRVGRKVPINVYDGDRPVCQCHNEEDAARIVIAVNAISVTGTCYARLPNGWCALPSGHEGEHKYGTGD
jgi:hypothetical protein